MPSPNTLMGTLAVVMLVVFLVIAAVIASILGVFYARFRRTPEFVWRQSVLDRRAWLDDRIATLKDDLQTGAKRQRAAAEKARDDSLRDYLASISVNELQEFPGIGPGTIGKLREAGLVNLGRLTSVRLDLPGIGPKREQDLRKAIGQLLRDAESRLDSGACPEAAHLSQRLREIEAESERKQERNIEDLAESEFYRNALRPYVRIARQVTFYCYFTGQEVDELDQRLLNRSIDDLLGRPPTRRRPATEPPTKAERMPTPRDVDPPRPAKPLVSPDLFASSLATIQAHQRAEHPRLPQLNAAVKFAYAVAKADGRIAASERDAIRVYLQATFGHEIALLAWIHPLMEQVEKSPPTLDECLAPMKNLFDTRELEALYRFACQVADAAGKRNAKEVACLNRIATAWGVAQVPAGHAAPSKTPPTPSSDATPQDVMGRDEALAVLEIHPGTKLSGDLVRRQYRLMSEHYDPSKFESHGSDFVTVARDKRARIEQAARLLSEQLGETFEATTIPEPPKDFRHNPDLDAAFGM